MMKKLLTMTLIAMVIANVFTPVMPAVQAAVMTNYYVSPTGNDTTGTGTSANPFATIQKARDAAYAIGTWTGDVIVNIKEGEYYNTSTIAFNYGYGGKNGNWIRYISDPNNTTKPRIIGGQKITGWTGPDIDGVYSAPSGGSFNNLYVNGEPAERARWPKKAATNTGKGQGRFTFNFATSGAASATTMTITPADINSSGMANISGLIGAQIFFLPTNAVGRGRADEYACVSTISNANQATGLITMLDAIGNETWLTPGSAPYIVSGPREFLTEEGEWALNKTTNTVYYKPKAGENMSSIEIIAPRVKTLVHLNNGPSNISFEGLQFEVADSDNFIAIKPSDPSPSPALIYANGIYATNVKIDECNLYNTGFAAFYVNSSSNYEITNNHIKNIGWSAFSINGGGATSNVTIDHNLIENVGYVDSYSEAFTVSRSTNVSFTHNLVDGCAGSGVTLIQGADLNNCVVSYNEFVNCLQFGSDMGVLYAWSNSTANNPARSYIENNYVHDCGTKVVLDGLYGGGQILHALYFDQFVNNFTVRNNIFADVSCNYEMYPIMVKGKNHIIENNICYQSNAGLIGHGAGVKLYDDGATYINSLQNASFGKNIYYLPNAWALYYFQSNTATAVQNAVSSSDNNLLYFPNGGTYNVVVPGSAPANTKTFNPTAPYAAGQWQYDYNLAAPLRPYDRNSKIADPMFVDPANDDFKFQQGSPAIAMGIAEIDTDLIGLRDRGILPPRPPVSTWIPVPYDDFTSINYIRGTGPVNWGVDDPAGTQYCWAMWTPTVNTGAGIEFTFTGTGARLTRSNSRWGPFDHIGMRFYIVEIDNVTPYATVNPQTRANSSSLDYTTEYVGQITDLPPGTYTMRVEFFSVTGINASNALYVAGFEYLYTESESSTDPKITVHITQHTYTPPSQEVTDTLLPPTEFISTAGNTTWANRAPWTATGGGGVTLTVQPTNVLQFSGSGNSSTIIANANSFSTTYQTGHTYIFELKFRWLTKTGTSPSVSTPNAGAFDGVQNVFSNTNWQTVQKEYTGGTIGATFNTFTCTFPGTGNPNASPIQVQYIALYDKYTNVYQPVPVPIEGKVFDEVSTQVNNGTMLEYANQGVGDSRTLTFVPDPGYQAFVKVGVTPVPLTNNTLTIVDDGNDKHIYVEFLPLADSAIFLNPSFVTVADAVTFYGQMVKGPSSPNPTGVGFEVSDDKTTIFSDDFIIENRIDPQMTSALEGKFGITLGLIGDAIGTKNFWIRLFFTDSAAGTQYNAGGWVQVTLP